MTTPAPPPQADPLRAHLEHFRRRVITDALLEATTTYWLRRAATFTAVGNPACDQIALACQHKAQLLQGTGLDQAAQAVIDQILHERHGQQPHEEVA